MKELLTSEDGFTFTSALKGIKGTKSASPAFKHQLSALRDSRAHVPKRISYAQLTSSRTRITERKNLTLRQLYQQFEENSRNEYVIRLKYDGLMRSNSPQSFDSWLGTLKVDGIQTSPRVDLQLNSPQIRRGISCEKLSRQISENLLAISNKLTKKQTQTTQQSVYDQHFCSHIQTKYSFSHYFSQHSDPQQTKNSPQLETVAKVSLRSSSPTFQDEVVQDQPNRQSKQPQNIYPTNQLGKWKNKENLNPNLNNAHCPEGKIVGLEFSKNRRFKSTKRRRKAEK